MLKYWKKPMLFCCRLIWVQSTPLSPANYQSRYVHHPYFSLRLTSLYVTFLFKMIGEAGWGQK